MMKSILYTLCLLLAIQVWAQPPGDARGEGWQKKVRSIMDAYSQLGKFNGSVLVARGDTIWKQAYGTRDHAAAQANTTASIFQVGSVTKPFTSIVIMQLVEAGKLSLADTLGTFLPGFKNGDKITIAHLLTHTSGIYNYTNDTAVMKSDLTRPVSRQQMLALVRGYLPDFAPGEKFSYSNSGYVILGSIIEKITGRSYEQNVRERILQPLQMHHSGFDFTHLNAPEKSKGYFSLTPHLEAPVMDSTISFAAGALYSTIDDLYKWERGVTSGKLLKAESWKQAFTPFKSKYGFGWVIDSLHGKLIMAHSGGIPGFTSYLLRLPGENAVIILLDNAFSSSLSRISLDLAAALLNKPYELPAAKKEIEVPLATLKFYEGNYQLAPAFFIRIRVDGKKLKLQATGQPEFELFAEKEDLFFLKVVEAKVAFVKNAAGEVDKLILYQNGMELNGNKVN